MIDIRRVLATPMAYKAFQWAVGAAKLRRILTAEYIQPNANIRILDIGCGTAEIVDYLGGARYVGLDPSSSYISAARRRHPEATFHVAGVNDKLEIEEPFDRVLAIGVLHHLNDQDAAALVALAARALAPNGRLITIDPAIVRSGSSSIRDAMVTRDRGQWVRSASGYQSLVESDRRFAAHSSLRQDLLRIPFSHCIVIGSLRVQHLDQKNREIATVERGL